MKNKQTKQAIHTIKSTKESELKQQHEMKMIKTVNRNTTKQAKTTNEKLDIKNKNTH